MTDTPPAYRGRTPHTWEQARDAYLDGRAAEALRWLRLFDTLSARIQTEDQPSDAATATASPDTADVHELHELHPVFSESPAEPFATPEPPPAPAGAAVPNRVERRRQNHAHRQQHRSSA